MSQLGAIGLGAGICCVVPLLALLAGVYIGKNGLPVSVRWRGARRRLADDGDADD